MNYEELIIKDEFLNVKLSGNYREIVLSNDMLLKDKAYVYNMITKSVFKTKNDLIVKDIDIEIEPIIEKELKIIHISDSQIEDIKPIPKKRGRKPKNK